MVPMIKALAQTDTLEIKLYKITTGLQVPNTTLPSIEVAPNANFALDVRAELWIEPAASTVDTPWVMLGSLEKRLGYTQHLPLHFSLTNQTDGTNLTATLQLSGVAISEGPRAAYVSKSENCSSKGLEALGQLDCQARANAEGVNMTIDDDEDEGGCVQWDVGGDYEFVTTVGEKPCPDTAHRCACTHADVAAQNSTIRLSTVVQSIPSLTKSKMWAEGKRVVQWPLLIAISAFDEDEKRIKEARSRYFEIALRTPKARVEHYQTTFRPKDQTFIASVPSSTLSTAGTYEAWVTRVFTFDLVPNVTTRPGLYTETNKLTVEIAAEPETSRELMMAIGIGAMLALCVMLLLYLVRNNPAKAKKILVSFLSVEVLLALKAFWAGFDFYTDTHVLVNEVLKASSSITHDILVPWIIFYAISSVVAIAALFMLLQNFIRAIRLRRQEIDLEVGTDGQNSLQAKLLKHKKNKERASRTIQGIYASMLIAAAENLPLGILMVVFSLRKGTPDAMGMISLATSWAQLGSSLGKIVLLKDLLPYRNKQVRKVKQLEALLHSHEGVELATVHADSKPRAKLLSETSEIQPAAAPGMC